MARELREGLIEILIEMMKLEARSLRVMHVAEILAVAAASRARPVYSMSGHRSAAPTSVFRTGDMGGDHDHA